MPHLTLSENLWALVGGLVTGALFSLVGSGGSALAVPLLTTLVGLSRVRVAMGTTAVAMAATAIMSTVLHARRGAVLWPVALSFTLPGIAGVFLGAHLQNDLPSHLLLTLLGLVLLFNASMMVGMRADGMGWKPMLRIPVLVRFGPFGLAVGVLAGMLGMGGGFLALPSMVLGGVSLSSAIGSSVVSVGSLGVASAISYSLRGLVDWHVVVEYVAGGLFGSILTAPVARRLMGRRRTLSMMLAVLLTGVSLYLIANNVASLYTPHGVI